MSFKNSNAKLKKLIFLFKTRYAEKQITRHYMCPFFFFLVY